jgi:2-polyprenyl-6-methoxyphenol hydroxylase-like FAD-dependent oxidoreductase
MTKRSISKRKEDIMDAQLPETTSTTQSERRAVVIGGSIAGMLAARILADHFDHVTVIDRDHYPAEPGFRKGAPQSRHIHILLGRGQQVMEALFPGLTGTLKDEGVPYIEWGYDTQTRFANGLWLRDFHSGAYTLATSRELLEWHLRSRLAQNERVEFRESCAVAGLLTDHGTAQVNGVLIEAVGAKDSERPERLEADFVVDASGRTSHAPEWLKAMGYGETQETVVNSFLGYATRWYKMPENFDGSWKWIASQPVMPDSPRGGMVAEMEGSRWVVTVAGAMRDYPPTDEEGFMAFTRSLGAPEIYEAIKDAEPITPIYGYQRTSNVWRHYEKLESWPDGFVVLGDAACAFNPVYGQGMSSAAMAAMELDSGLRDYARHGSLRGMSGRFQKRLAKALAPVWVMATGEDYRYPTTEGPQISRMTRFTHWYIDRVLNIIPTHSRAATTFIQVMQLLKPGSALFHPAILWGALRYKAPKQAAARRASEQPQAVIG